MKTTNNEWVKEEAMERESRRRILQMTKEGS